MTDSKSEASGLKISLAAWSLHRAFFARETDLLGMLETCGDLGITGFELVNTFFPSPQYGYLSYLRQRAQERGIELLVVTCDGEGNLGDAEREKRLLVARNHRKWVDIAAVLGCYAIRCNVLGDESDPDAMRERAAEALGELLAYAAGTDVDILIENHVGRLSSDAAWLRSLIDLVGSPHLGLLPDFANFPAEVDRYDGVAKMMPLAKAVHAKCHDFGPDGAETSTDFPRMMDIVKAAGYRGYVSIEYEGDRLPEREGILASKALLERLI